MFEMLKHFEMFKRNVNILNAIWLNTYITKQKRIAHLTIFRQTWAFWSWFQHNFHVGIFEYIWVGHVLSSVVKSVPEHDWAECCCIWDIGDGKTFEMFEQNVNTLSDWTHFETFGVTMWKYYNECNATLWQVEWPTLASASAMSRCNATRLAGAKWSSLVGAPQHPGECQYNWAGATRHPCWRKVHLARVSNTLARRKVSFCVVAG